MINFFLCIFIVYTAFVTGCSGRKEVIPISVSGVHLEVEYAGTPEKHMKGLMNRKSLAEDEGMLFIFPEEKVLSFWMKNTHIPLSIAFIDGEGKIIQIEAMEPHSLDLHVSRKRARFALEMNRDWFRRHKIKEGDVVRIPSVLKAE